MKQIKNMSQSELAAHIQDTLLNGYPYSERMT
jgi:hypothetical protein